MSVWLEGPSNRDTAPASTFGARRTDPRSEWLAASLLHWRAGCNAVSFPEGKGYGVGLIPYASRG